MLAGLFPQVQARGRKHRRFTEQDIWRGAIIAHLTGLEWQLSAIRQHLETIDKGDLEGNSLKERYQNLKASEELQREMDHYSLLLAQEKTKLVFDKPALARFLSGHRTPDQIQRVLSEVEERGLIRSAKVHGESLYSQRDALALRILLAMSSGERQAWWKAPALLDELRTNLNVDPVLQERLPGGLPDPQALLWNAIRESRGNPQKATVRGIAFWAKR